MTSSEVSQEIQSCANAQLMSADIEEWPPPNDPTAFESLCLDLFREIWKDSGAQKNGRSGQPQAGVDVFGISDGRQIGIQCKQKDGLLRTKLSKAELEREVEAAKRFRPELAAFILATTGPRDGRLQESARLISEKHKERGLFSVEVWSWKEIWPELYQRKELFERIRDVYWPRLSSPSVSRRGIRQNGILLVIILGLVSLVALVVSLRNKEYSRGNSISDLIQVKIEQLAGLPEGMTNNPKLRLNRVVVRNIAQSELIDLCSRLQLPEAIGVTIETNKTTGTQIGWKPLLDKLSISGTGGRTETGLWIGPTSSVHFVESIPCFQYSGKPRGQLGMTSKLGDNTGIWELTADRIPPNGFVEILFLTSIDSAGKNYLDFAGVPLWQSPPNASRTPNTNELRYFLEGGFRMDVNGKSERSLFFVPIEYDFTNRNVSSLPIQSDAGQWHPVTLTFQ